MSIIKTRSQERLDRAAEEAALLEAAQAQARAEEEISARLPREVLNINRCLDLHQASVDQIYGDLSSLTDMVRQFGVSLGKRPPGCRRYSCNHCPHATAAIRYSISLPSQPQSDSGRLNTG
jgi:hypothetical protein